MNIGEIVGRLILKLLEKEILSKQDVVYILGEKNFNQMLLTADLIMSGIFTKEDLDNQLDKLESEEEE